MESGALPSTSGLTAIFSLLSIFSPVPFSRDVGNWVVLKAGFDPGVCWEHRSWELEWRAEDCFDRLTVWAPLPEVAPQLIYDMLQIYLEKPLSTGMIFLISWVVQRRWSRLSCCVLEVGVYPLALVPVSHNSHLTIPIVLLLIPFHVRVLPDLRLDPAPNTNLRRLHKQLATSLHGS
jgi:hypothetical protein